MAKVLLVLPSNKRGGAEKVMLLLAEAFAEKGFETHLVLFVFDEAGYPLPRAIHMHELGFSYKTGGGRIWAMLRGILRLRKRIIALHPDFILSFMIKANIATLLGNAGIGRPVFISDRSNPYRPQQIVLFVLRFLLYRLATGVVAQTEVAKKLISTKYSVRNITVIPNPVRQIAKSNSRENLIIGVGRLVKSKSFHTLISYFSAANLDNSWRLVILGGGPEEDALNDLIRTLGMSQRIILQGEVSDVEEWLCKASVFCMTSISEGYPNALLEAMSAGLPVIAVDCPVGPSEVIMHGESGFLIGMGDKAAYVDRMELLANDSLLRYRLGVAAASTAATHSIAKVSNDYLTFCSGASLDA